MEKAPHRPPARRAALLLAAAACAAVAAPARAANISLTWDSSTGDWFDPTQWTPNAIPNNDPTNQYLPNIPAGTVTLSANATINALTLAAPATLILDPAAELDAATSQLSGSIYLDPAALLNTSGSATFDGASIAGPGSLTVGGTATFLGTSTISNVSVSASVIEAAGTLFIADGTAQADHLTLSDYAPYGPNVLDGPGTLALSGPNQWYAGNMAGTGETLVTSSGSLTITPALQSLNLDSRTLRNQGIATASSGWLNMVGNSVFDNEGTLTLSSFDFNFTSPQATGIPVLLNEGVFSVAGNGTGTRLNVPVVSAGTIALGPGADLLFQNGGTLTGSLITAASNSYFTFGTRLPGASSVTPPSAPLILSNATLAGPGYFLGYALIQGATSVNNGSFGSLGGPGTLTILNSLNLDADGLAPANQPPPTKVTDLCIQVRPGATMTLGFTGTLVLNGSSISNRGVINTNEFAQAPEIQFENGSAVDNCGIFSPPANSWTTDGNPANRFTNNGTLILVNPGFAPVTFPIPLFNTGVVQIASAQVGGYEIAGGGIASGTLTFSNLIWFAPASCVFASPYTLDGAALQPQVSGSPTHLGNFSATADLTIEGSVSASRLAFAAGLNGPGTLTGSGDAWIGGAISHTRIVIAGPLTLGTLLPATPVVPAYNFAIAASGTKLLDGATLTISPAITAAWALPASLNQQQDTITFQNGSQIQNSGSLYSFINQSAILDLDSNPSNGFYNFGTFGRGLPAVGSGSDTTTVAVAFFNSGLIDVQQGTIEFDGPFTQTAGTLGASGGTITGSALTLQGGSVLGRIPATLTISNSILLAGPTLLNAVPILASGSVTLDLINNSLVLEATDPTDKAAKIAALRALLQSAQSGPAGPWTGPGVTSSTVAEDAATQTAHTFHTTLALADNGSLLAPFTTFGGFTVDANSILLTRALVADGNLDNTVNNADLVVLLNHFGLNNQTQTGGDYDGNGTVDNADLVALLNDFGQSLPAGESLAANPSANTPSITPPNSPASPVPEPALLPLLALLFPALFRRRHRRPVVALPPHIHFKKIK